MAIKMEFFVKEERFGCILVTFYYKSQNFFLVVISLEERDVRYCFFAFVDFYRVVKPFQALNVFSKRPI